MSVERELIRIQYLQALDIQPLVARRVLPGAAPSRRLALRNPPPREAVPPVAPASRAGVVPAREGAAGASQEAQVRALRDSLDTAPARAPLLGPDATASGDEVAAEVRSDAGSSAETLAERFSLAVVIAGGRLWVEDLAGAALAREQVDLIGAMAGALHHPQPSGERPRITQFDWPMHSNAQLDLGPEEAARSLGSFLDRQADESACVAIVCLGDPAARRLAGLKLRCARVSLPATRDMLAEPRRKVDAWKLLCP